MIAKGASFAENRRIEDDPAVPQYSPFSGTDIVSTGIFVRPGTILIAANDPMIFDGFCQALKDDGHTILVASDDESARALATAEKPDVLLLDARLPGNGGLELCKQLKGDPELRFTPVIVISSTDNSDEHLNGIQFGANDFIGRNVDATLLKARVRSWLKYRRVVNALREANHELEKRVKERTSTLEREVSYRRQVEIALRESEERYALAARGANDGLWDWNIESGEVYYSPRWMAMAGLDRSSMEDTLDAWFRLVHPEDVEHLKAALDAHLLGGTVHFHAEYRIMYRDGTIRWMMCRAMAIRNSERRVCRMAGSQTDITERKLAEQQLLHNAFHDELTCLPNRALFLDRMGQAMRRVRRDEKLPAVIYIDLDRFKLVNDSLGYRTGNQLLIEVGRRLRRSVGPADTVGRLGGDEFAVLLDEAGSADEAANIADSVHEAMRAPFKLSARDVFLTASFGIVLVRKKYENPEDVVRDAETAMHQAKAMGTARQETFNSGMHRQVVTLMNLENDLRHSVECGEFCLQYQPVVALPGDPAEMPRLAGFEALVRWKHPVRGLIPPAEFLPVAEETDLITPLSIWILRKACAQLCAWQEKFPQAPNLSLSINMSARSISDEKFIDKFIQILGESSACPSRLKIELTESSIMHCARGTLASLARLKALNLELQIDDFGTGYSSLSYLHQLPIDVLKIDRSFVVNFESGQKNADIVATIVHLARHLNLKVVAEGVETEAQLARLRALKCDYAQGFYFAKPLDTPEAEKLMEAHILG